MDILSYRKARLDRGIGYTLFVMFIYQPYSDSELKEYISYRLEYFPHNKELIIGSPDTTGGVLKNHMKEINKLPEHILVKFNEEITQHNLLCDKVFHFLQEPQIQLEILSVKDISGDKVRLMINSVNRKHGLMVNIGMKDSENMSHFYIKESEDSYSISFHEPYEYTNIAKEFKQLITETEYRLKFLMCDVI